MFPIKIEFLPSLQPESQSSKPPPTDGKLRPYTCSEEGCKKSYTNKAHLTRHFKISHSRTSQEIKWFICDICKNGYRAKQSLEKHIVNTHLKRFPFRCVFCFKGFMKQNLLKAHLFEHTGLKFFRCDYCPKQFSSQTDKGIHQRKHRIYLCNCGKKFTSQACILQHKKNDHPNEGYECDKCHKIYDKRCHIIQHLKEHYIKEKPNSFSCHFCPRSYGFKKNLIHHIKVFHYKTKFDCTVPGCKAKLSSKQKLQYHIKSKHTEKLKKPLKKKLKARKKRRDAGSMTRSTAVKLSGLNVSLKMEKEIIKESQENSITKICNQMKDEIV